MQRWRCPCRSPSPVATLLINVVGSFFTGLFARTFGLPDHNPVLRNALIVGICGGFTTFPTCSAEIVTLLPQGRADRAAHYVCLNIAESVQAIPAGLVVGRSVGRHACATVFGIETETCYS